MSDENDKDIGLLEIADRGVNMDTDIDGPIVLKEAGPGLSAMMQDQDREAEQFAIAFLKKVIRLRGVRIEREQFLRAELHKRGIGAEVIQIAIDESPALAGISPTMLDQIADKAIDFETGKSTVLSFAAGLPGGFAMIGTVPADITQFYVHAFRVMQKIAYVYGWQSFLDDIEEIDDETLGVLASFLGVMMGVGGASVSVTAFAAQVARPAVQKKIAGIALTKTVWYVPMKQTMKIIGVEITKQSFAKTVSKVVPVIGGAVSGGLTFVTLSLQSNRLMKHLRELPPPNVDAETYLAAVVSAGEMRDRRKKAVAETFDKVGSKVKSAASTRVGTGLVDAAGAVTRPFRSVDIDGDGIPDEPQALTKVKGVGGALAGTAGSMGEGVAGLFKQKKRGGHVVGSSKTGRGEPAEK